MLVVIATVRSVRLRRASVGRPPGSVNFWQPSYFHVVFTLPNELSALVLRNQRVLYDLLFRSVSATLLEIAADPKHLGAEIGFFGILHTWGQNLMHHPHIHCAIPLGGLAPDHSR